MYNIHRDTIPSFIHILFQSPLSLYHTSHQMSTVIFILSQNHDFRLHFLSQNRDFRLHFLSLPTIILYCMTIPEFNYQNNYSYSTSIRHIYTR